MQFNYYPERVQPSPIKTLFIDRYLLEPGLNDASDSLTKSRLFQKLLTNSAIERIEPVVKDPEPEVAIKSTPKRGKKIADERE